MNDLLKRIRDLLYYDPISGNFTWIVRMSSRTQEGHIAGTPNAGGYRRITIDGKHHASHRLAWLYHYGEWPKNVIDHINGCRSDNRIENLRDCTMSENNQNSSTSGRNTSGFKGVVKVASKINPWQARITTRGKCKNLGCFPTAEEAHKAYCSWADKNHGEFANYGLKARGEEK